MPPRAYCARHGYALLRVDVQDAHFVRLDAAAKALLSARLRGLELPMDEVDCYRRLRVWVSGSSLRFVREWFFGDLDAAFDRVRSNVSYLNGLDKLPLPFSLSKL